VKRLEGLGGKLTPEPAHNPKGKIPEPLILREV
jgi:hypothetical protein